LFLWGCLHHRSAPSQRLERAGTKPMPLTVPALPGPVGNPA
jgi:hypothetical protein